MSPRSHNFFKILFAGATLVVAFFLVGGVPKANAGATDRLAGWAWGENTGWISFNCTNRSSCATHDYGVTVNLATGALSGYAWSANVGWISFNAADVAGCPVGTCTPTMMLGENNGSVNGYARIVSYGAGDGYIRLSSGASGIYATNNPAGTQGVSYNYTTHELTGFAWSSELGWIKFGPTNNIGITVNVPEPDIDLSINNWKFDKNVGLHGIINGRPDSPQIAGVYLGAGATQIQWNIVNGQNCTATSTNNDPAWSGSISNSGTVSLTLAPTDNYIYGINCDTTYAGGTPVSEALKVYVDDNGADGFAAQLGQNQTPFQYFFNLSDSRTFTVNYIVPLSNYHDCMVTTEYGPSNAGNYVGGPFPAFTTIPAIAGGPINYDPLLRAKNFIFQIPNPGVIDLTKSYFVVFRCQNSAGAPITKHYAISPRSGTPLVTLSSSPSTTSVSPVAPGTSVAVTYHAGYNLTSCIPHSTPAIAGWDSITPIMNTVPNNTVPGLVVNQTTVFSLDCVDYFGNAAVGSVTVYVNNAAANVSLTASPATGLSPNGQTTLTYSTNNVSSCTTSTSTADGDTNYAGWTGRPEVATHLNQTDVDTSTGGAGTYDNGAQVTIGDTDTTFNLNCFGLDGVTPMNASVTVYIAKTLTLSFDAASLVDTKSVSSASPNVQLSWWSNAPLAGANCQTFSSPTSWWETYPVASSQIAPITSTSNAISGTTTFWMTCYDGGLTPVTSNTVVANWVSLVPPTVTLAGDTCLDPDDGGHGYPALTLNIFDPSGLINTCTVVDPLGNTHTWSSGAWTGAPIYITFPNSFTFTANCTVSAGSPPTINTLAVGFNGQASWCSPTGGTGHKGGLEYEEH